MEFFPQKYIILERLETLASCTESSIDLLHPVDLKIVLITEFSSQIEADLKVIFNSFHIYV